MVTAARSMPQYASPYVSFSRRSVAVQIDSRTAELGWPSRHRLASAQPKCFFKIVGDRRLAARLSLHREINRINQGINCADLLKRIALAA